MADLEKKGLHGESKLYEKPKIEVDNYPGEPAGFLVRGQKVGETWLKILRTIYDYGKFTKMKTKDSTQVRECINLVAVISDEDADSPQMEPYFRFDEAYLKSDFVVSALKSNRTSDSSSKHHNVLQVPMPPEVRNPGDSVRGMCVWGDDSVTGSDKLK